MVAHKIYEIACVWVLRMEGFDDEGRNLRFTHLASYDVPYAVSADYCRVKALVCCQLLVIKLHWRTEPVSEPSVRVSHKFSEQVIHRSFQCNTATTVKPTNRTAKTRPNIVSERTRLSIFVRRVSKAVFLDSLSLRRVTKAVFITSFSAMYALTSSSTACPVKVCQLNRSMQH